MAKIVAEEQVEYPTLPDDSIIHLKIEEANTVDVPGRSGDTWTKLEFKFKILGIQTTGDGSPVENYANLIGTNIYGSVPFRLTDSPENKLRIWAEAILGMDIGVGFELDTDYFLRREVRGITDSYEKRKSGVNPRTGRPFRQHQVMTLLRAGAPAPTPAPQVGGWGQATQAAPQQQQFQPQQMQQQPQDPWAPQPVGAGQPQQQQGFAFQDDPPF